MFEKGLEVLEKNLDLDKNLYIVDINKDGRKDKSEKMKWRRRIRIESFKKSFFVVERYISYEDVVLECFLKESFF